jgi:PAS domain S-box-containing protein
MKKELSIKNISMYGFLTILIMTLISGGLVFLFLNKIENLNHQYQSFESSYTNMFSLKYYTERLLTTTNLAQEKKLFIEAKDIFKEDLELLPIDDKIRRENIIAQWKVVDSESNIILKKLDNELFQAKNTMDKSILRRLGEGLNSNTQSDYYLALVDLGHSIDYLKQYEEFLLDELNELKIKQQNQIFNKINETKKTGIISLVFMLLLTTLIVSFITRLIIKVENNLRNTQETLQENLDETNYILNTVMESIVISENGVCIDVNDETLRTFNYTSKSELIGKSTDIFIAPESLELVQSQEKSESVEPYEINCITNDGKILPSIIKVYNFKNKSGTTIRISAIVNLSEIKDKDRLIFQQSKMATMGEMLENIAHQWRQPLSVITTLASGLDIQITAGIVNNEQISAKLTKIVDSAQHMSQTIDDFRDFFKSNKEKKAFNIVEAVERTFYLLSSKLSNRSIIILKDCEDVTIIGYENELIQAFMNIVNNAIDVLEESKQSERLIQVTIKKVDGEVYISLKDNGGGIAQEVLKKIFDEHFTTKGDKDGTGIGLYMTKMIVEKLNGTIIAQNETFTYNDETFNGVNFIITFQLPQEAEVA